METLIPISPVRTKSGSFAVLSQIYGEELTKPIPLNNNSTQLYNNFQVFQKMISISAAAQLQVGTIFGGVSSYKDQGFYYDAIAYTDEYEYGSVGDKLIYATRWGVGIRIAIRVSEIKSEFSFTLGSIAAAVQLGAAKAQYEILGLGLGLDGLVIVLENVVPISDFTFNTYIALQEKVIKNLGRYIKQNKADLVPQPVAVGITQNIESDLLSQAQSVLYAMTKISKPKSLKEAIDQSGSKFNVSIIKQTYREIVGDVPIDDKPSATAEARAEKWLNEVG